MRRKVKRFTDEEALAIATEFVTTSSTISELKSKYGFTGDGTIYNWMRKFGLSSPSEDELKLLQIMKTEQNKSPKEEALEREIAALKKELELEKLKSRAYQKMIEIAERDLSITIKKKSGHKQ